MNPDDWKAFINHLFVNTDGTRKAALLTITIEAEDGKLNLPPLSVAHTDTLQQIFVKASQLPPTQQEQTAEQTPTEQHEATGRLKTVNVEHIKQGKTEYIVYRMIDDSFRVVKANGDVVTPNTIVYNKVVKKYREQFPIQ